MSRKKAAISTEFAERLSVLMEKVGYGGRQKVKFANKIGVSSSYLSDILSLKSGPSFGLISGIATVFPEIDINWLLTGEGEALAGTHGQAKAKASRGSPCTGAPDVIEIQHLDIVRQFRHKEEAKQINQMLQRIEAIDDRQFFRVMGKIEAELERIEKEKGPLLKKTELTRRSST